LAPKLQFRATHFVEAIMPIYAYRCSSCGHGADVMQKLSDAPLTVCTACGQATFSKQITAAGFQLRGSGWYATDFKNGSKGTKKEAGAGEKVAETTSETKATEGSVEKKADSTEKKADSSEKKADSGEKKSDSGNTKPAAQAGARRGRSACS
jgi:putative FmdB family regulatory protein